MIEKLALWFLIFMFYSIGGWLVEVVVTLVEHRKLVNRGFLVGPLCPIYGIGAVIISVTMHSLNITNPALIFAISFLGGGLLEYFSSYWMEKLFRVRWWDYSNKMIHLNGRVCMSSMMSFGVAGIIIVRFITPFIYGLLSQMRPWMMLALAGILVVWLIADVILSLWLIVGVRVTVGTVARDATDEIQTRVREVLMDKSKLNQRLVKAFPNQKPSKKLPPKKKS